MTRPRSALVLVLSALTLAACGGDGDGADATGVPADDEQGYEERVRAADAEIAATGERLAAATTPGELEEVRSGLEQTARRVEQGSPPYDLLPEHQQLTLAIWQAVDEASVIVDEGREHLGGEDLTTVVEALAEAEAAIGEMEAKGYDVRRRT